MGNLSTFILLAPGILAALTVHEFSHGYMAFRLGDNTARDHGRLTLNPLAHLDPVGTIMLFLFHFGWAKPVPVNPYNFRGDIRDMRRGMIWVSLAGPGSNVIFAAVLGLLLQLLLATSAINYSSTVYMMLTFGVFINLMLAFFNLIPIPPLDGSKVVEGLLPVKYLANWQRFERMGFFVLIGIILVSRMLHIPIFGATIFPIAGFFYGLFTGDAPLMLR